MSWIPSCTSCIIIFYRLSTSVFGLVWGVAVLGGRATRDLMKVGHMEIMQVEYRWNTGGVQVEYRWSTGGIQVEYRWNTGAGMYNVY